jgi:L-fuculose-phosphate aldolase
VSKWQEEKRIVMEAAMVMAEKGLVVGSAGNVSMRLPSEDGRGLLAITPSRKNYEALTLDDIQVIDFEAESIEGDLPPSIESMVHIGVYKARKNIKAVIHTHSTFASVMAVAGLEIPSILEDQMVVIGGEVKLAEYAPSGSDEMVENIVNALGERNAVLLQNHGAVGIGKTMRDALIVCELLERTAQVYLCALSLGKANPLPDEAIETGKAFFALLQSGD